MSTIKKKKFSPKQAKAEAGKIKKRNQGRAQLTTDQKIKALGKGNKNAHPQIHNTSVTDRQNKKRIENGTIPGQGKIKMPDKNKKPKKPRASSNFTSKKEMLRAEETARRQINSCKTDSDGKPKSYLKILVDVDSRYTKSFSKDQDGNFMKSNPNKALVAYKLVDGEYKLDSAYPLDESIKLSKEDIDNSMFF